MKKTGHLLLRTVAPSRVLPLCALALAALTVALLAPRNDS